MIFERKKKSFNANQFNETRKRIVFNTKTKGRNGLSNIFHGNLCYVDKIHISFVIVKSNTCQNMFVL